VGAHDGAASEEEEFAGVEAGLVVYVDVACVVRRLAAVGPPCVSAPRAWPRQENRAAAALRRLILCRHEFACRDKGFRRAPAFGSVDDAELVVAHCEGGGLVEVGVRHAGDFPDAEEAFAPEDDVGGGGRKRDGDDGVVARDGKRRAAPLADVRDSLKLAAELVECGVVRRRSGAALLRGVVERGEIEIRLVDVVHLGQRLEPVDAAPSDLRRGEGAPVPP